ncbi:MAG: methyltransferase domain-containing protein [Parachlamydia sp.]|nr:methyltransferase domain-containing protein [Parachlamydia sp.]
MQSSQPAHSSVPQLAFDSHLRSKWSMKQDERKSEISSLVTQLLQEIDSSSPEECGNFVMKQFFKLDRYDASIASCELVQCGKKGNFILIDQQRAYRIPENSFIPSILKTLAKTMRGNEIAISYSPQGQIGRTGLPDHYWSQWRTSRNVMSDAYDQIDSNMMKVIDQLYAGVRIPFSAKVGKLMRILELFGGVGNLAEAILKKHPAAYTMIDFNQPSLDKASEKLTAACPPQSTFTLHQADIVNARFETFLKGDKADLVIVEGGLTEQVLNSKMDAMRVVKKAYETLNDDGVMIVSGLGQHWVDVESLTPYFHIHNSFDASRQREFYVLRKRKSPLPFKLHQGTLDLYKPLYDLKNDPQRVVKLIAELKTAELPWNDVRTLDLSETDLTPGQLEELLRHFPHLKNLKLCSVAGDLAEVLSKLPALETLDLSHTHVSSSMVDGIIQRLHLKDVALNYCPFISPNEQALIRAKLAFQKNPHKPNLFFLSYRHYRDKNLFTWVFDQLIAQGYLKEGVVLKLGDVAISDEIAFKIIQHVGVDHFELKYLTYSSLSAPFKLALQRLRNWQNPMPGVIILNRDDTQLDLSAPKTFSGDTVDSGKALKWITLMAPREYLQKFRSINLAATSLSLKDLSCLAAFPHLESLNLQNCAFEEVTNPFVSSVDLSCLHPLKLTHINFVSSNIDGHTPRIATLFKPDTPLFAHCKKLTIRTCCHNLASFCDLPKDLIFYDPKYLPWAIGGAIYGDINREGDFDSDDDLSQVD